MADFPPEDYAHIAALMRQHLNDDAQFSAVMSNNFNVILGALDEAALATRTPREAGEADEDAFFAAQYSDALRRGDWEEIARKLSGRLRQMDKRAKAANIRADRSALTAEAPAAGVAEVRIEELERALSLSEEKLTQFHVRALQAETDLRARPWRCFHCDEVFTDERCARDHFGASETCEPACQIKMGAERSLLAALRRAEDDANEMMQRLSSETTDSAKAYFAQTARHQEQLRIAEELGFERGLAAAPLPTKGGLEP